MVAWTSGKRASSHPPQSETSSLRLGRRFETPSVPVPATLKDLTLTRVSLFNNLVTQEIPFVPRMSTLDTVKLVQLQG